LNTRLYVLGMLSSGPKHGYEIGKIAADHGVDLWADVLPGSVYHALKALAAEGCLTTRGAEQTGNRSRAVYAITAAGASELGRLVREELRDPPRSLPGGLYAAMNFAALFGPDELRAAIDALIVKLDDDLVRWKAANTAQPGPDLRSRLAAEMAANGAEHMEADRRYLSRILEILPQPGG
jgi:DNA-binding PadR family transcriptional regulator